MGSLNNLVSFVVVILIILELPSPSHCAKDYTNLVYKGCAKNPLSDPSGAYSQALSSIYGTLIAQSSKTKFYKATQSSITGLFQCRGDLSNVDCYNCVSKLPILMDKLCGRVVASRIQLYGCYMLYEVSGYAQISGMEMLYKSCSGTNRGGAGFEEKRDTALNSLENGIGSSIVSGFYANSFEGVYVMGQCEGDVGNSDCVACVKNAVQRAQVECGSAVSGQVYLHKCWIGYSFYSKGLPEQSPSGSFPSSSSPSGSPNTGKTVAIILGGAAGVGFLVICLLFARGLIKKKDDY